MAPATILDSKEIDTSTSSSSFITSPTKATPSTTALTLASKFAPYRTLVPVLSNSSTSTTATITYLNASFSPPSNLVVHSAITRFSHEALHDPHPKPGWQSAVEDVRALVARYINAASPSSIAFTRDTTEALGNFIRSVPFSPGDNIVLLDTEHPNHVYGWMALRQYGLEVRQVPTIQAAEETGVVAATAETFAPYVDSRTRAIGLSSIMFHSGQWNDVQGICASFRPRGIHVLGDLTQQVGFASLDVQALGLSAAAFSLHKGLNCPTGLACLYVDQKVLEELNPTPPVVGYGAVANVRADLLVPADKIIFHPSARRFEHLNLSLIAIAAAKAYLTFYLDTLGPKELEEYLHNLGDELRKECRELGISIVGPEDRKVHAPHLYILNLLDPAWATLLRSEGIYVTPYRLGIRVSLGFYNNVADIKTLARALRKGLDEGLPIPRK